MKLASFRTSNGINSYGIVTDTGIIDLGARLGSRYPDLRALIAGDAFAEAQKLAGNSPDHKLAVRISRAPGCARWHMGAIAPPALSACSAE